jgi:cyclopropane-fatty-acyl-phospholipid synthase
VCVCGPCRQLTRARAQVITIPDSRYEEYLRTTDFIQEYVFPGGHLPSFGALTSAMAAHSKLQVHAVQNIGPHYAVTLQHWRKAYVERQADVLRLGFDERFLRLFAYYFDYCIAGFRTHTLDTLQIVLTRPNNPAVLEEFTALLTPRNADGEVMEFNAAAHSA